MDETALPRPEEFFADLSAAYGRQIEAMGSGLHIPAVGRHELTYLNDPKQRELVSRMGIDADTLHLRNPHHERGDRGQTRGHDDHHASVPREFPVVVGG